ncbi:hypothetical protein [Amycolatopsis anabasis]|uniref:hypothetical protein n=1 Tax=Amycolatopsis anabasis TaxID=1840409 RepID=UPI00131B5813|nr:hypothetical protein [Amycolatopsis anabasis]
MAGRSEQRDFVALRYRTRASLYNQAPTALDYAAGHISEPFEPEDDDQLTANDVHVTREGGSSYRAVEETGALSVQPPPDGVGRYEKDNLTINMDADGQLTDHANWRLHLGTVDEARYSYAPLWRTFNSTPQ